MNGIVIKSTGSNYSVFAGGKIIPCKIKGLFRIKGIDTTNPVVVGDKVEIDLQRGNDTGWITNITERKNYIIRKATNLSKQAHVIASNLDLALVIATPVLPKTSTGFIDRFLTTAESYSIPAGIIFNKKDLYNDELYTYVDELKNLYEDIGYKIFVVSAMQEVSLAELKNVLKNKVTLFSGHSGVGKSTLINTLIPGLNLKTAEISEHHLKGIHTTSFTEMHQLPGGGFIIDTPGIREFGILDVVPSEVSHYFPEMFKLIKDCRFHNCTHTNETKCAVLKGLEEGVISESRYASYISIVNNQDIFK